jgi:hypothetical protein
MACFRLRSLRELEFATQVGDAVLVAVGVGVGVVVGVMVGVEVGVEVGVGLEVAEDEVACLQTLCKSETTVT